MLEKLRDGDWLTLERMRIVAVTMLVAMGLAIIALLVTSDGRNDYQGRPLGSDFSNIYAAGKFVLESKPAKPFDWPAQHKREKEIFGAETPFYGWHYPPFFLIVGGALATMPYLLALTMWQVVTLLFYLVCIHAILFPGSWKALSDTGLLVRRNLPTAAI